MVHLLLIFVSIVVVFFSHFLNKGKFFLHQVKLVKTSTVTYCTYIMALTAVRYLDLADKMAADPTQPDTIPYRYPTGSGVGPV